MKQSQMSALLGFVIFLAVIIFVVGVLWLSGTKLKKEGYPIQILFDSVHGLKKGDPVTVAGVSAGDVQTIDLSSKGAVVTVWLNKNIFLPKDTSAYLSSTDVMGTKVINLEPGDSHEALNPSDVLIGRSVGGLTDIIEITEELKSVLKGVGKEENRVNLSMSLEKLNIALTNLNEILADNKENLNETIKNLKESTQTSSELLGGNQENLDTIIENIKNSSGKLDTVSTNLDQTILEIQTITSKLNNGQGTLGKLLNEDSLYFDMRNTVKSADSLIYDIGDLTKDIKENPRRYINLKFSLF